MAKIVKFAVLGAGVGAGYAAVQAYRRDEPLDVLANQAGKVAAEGAAVGVVTALLLGRRSSTTSPGWTSSNSTPASSMGGCSRGATTRTC